jgi:hypothetical protein
MGRSGIMALDRMNWLRLSTAALALGVIALPGAALADPDRERPARGEWRDRGDSGGRAPAWQGRQSANRQAPAAQAVPRQAAEAPPAPPPQSRGTWGQAGGNRNNWEGRGNREERGVASWQGNRAVAPTSSAQRARDDRDGRVDRNWSRNRSYSGRDTANAWAPRSGDRDGRHDRWREHGGDRTYWRNNNWSSHWDRSRHHRWSGWNNHWNWTWGSHYNRWDRNWRHHHRYNWYDWRYRNPSYFQVGFYYAPYRNYSYRRLSIGFFLDALFYGDEYWIADPGYYRLPEVYGPYRWVRYYDDAVLVDIYTGEVVDVIHRFFW